jgi:hypothetical protein
MEQRSKAWEDEASFDKSPRNTFSFNLFNKYFKGSNFYHVGLDGRLCLCFLGAWTLWAHCNVMPNFNQLWWAHKRRTQQ